MVMTVAYGRIIKTHGHKRILRPILVTFEIQIELSRLWRQKFGANVMI